MNDSNKYLKSKQRVTPVAIAQELWWTNVLRMLVKGLAESALGKIR